MFRLVVCDLSPSEARRVNCTARAANAVLCTAGRFIVLGWCNAEEAWPVLAEVQADLDRGYAEGCTSALLVPASDPQLGELLEAQARKVAEAVA